MTQERLIDGIITKGIGGFYYIEASGLIYECKARGLFRKDKITPMVGDMVQIQLLTDHEAVIKKIYPRQNQFIRPPVANVDIAIIVSALVDPVPNYAVIDKLIVMAERQKTQIVLVMNKKDRADQDLIEKVKKVYQQAGYPLFFVSAATGEGLDLLREALAGKSSMLAGPSGVGKSSLVNKMEGLQLQTGEISEKTQRGKHTTRHVELLKGRNGVRIFDTPGFTSFELSGLLPQELKMCYSEFTRYEGDCKFADCNHNKETVCGVKEAVKEGKLSLVRYENYIRLYEELMGKGERYL